MTLVFNTRDATQDVDAIFEPRNQISVISEGIAKENGLSETWLNDSVKAYVEPSMSQQIIFEFTALTVKSVDAESLLAMKLAAARPEGKDFEDAATLMQHLQIEDIDTAYSILDKHIPKSQLTGRVSVFTQAVYQKYEKDKDVNSLDKVGKEVREASIDLTRNLPHSQSNPIR